MTFYWAPRHGLFNETIVGTKDFHSLSFMLNAEIYYYFDSKWYKSAHRPRRWKSDFKIKITDKKIKKLLLSSDMVVVEIGIELFKEKYNEKVNKYNNNS